MNKLKMLEELAQALQKIKYHPKLMKDISNLVFGKGHEVEFFKLFANRLKQMQVLGIDVLNLSEFEKLKGEKSLYSMHLTSSNFNIRIVYSFDNCNQILLHGFYERSGKKVSSYAKHTEIAKSKKEDLM